MDINELMIGDWVYNKHHEKAIKLTPYDFVTHGHDGNGNQFLLSNPTVVSGKDLEPILLTEEVLKNCGFVKENTWNDIITMKYHLCEEDAIVDGGMTFDKTIDIEIEFSTIKNSIRHIYINCFLESMAANIKMCNKEEIFYVHQLQHALNLCSIKKVIVV